MENVVLIVVDTLRAKSLGLYGKNPSSSPFLDALSKKGVVFKNAYTTTVRTDPAITAIMSGNYPLHNGLVNHEEKITKNEYGNINRIAVLPEIFLKQGYFTAAIDWLSRWHARGFTYYSGWLSKGKDKKDHDFGQNFFYRFMRIVDMISLKIIRRDFLSRTFYSILNNQPPYDPADKVVDKAIEALAKNKSKFFLYVHLWDTHYPYVRPKGIKSVLFDSIEKRYLAQVKFVDQQLQRLIEDIRERKLLKKTLIVITGDHGESLTEHGILISHKGLFDETVKVPLIFYNPDLSHKEIESLVQHVDILPTIIDLLKIKYDVSDRNGKSLVPLMNGSSRSVRNSVYFEDLTPGELGLTKDVRRRGIRNKNYKYIQELVGKREDLFSVYPNPDKTIMTAEEIYDLRNDPLEQINILKESNGLRIKLKKEMEVYMQTINDNLLEKVKKSKNVIMEARKGLKDEDIAVAWTGGKDSTVLLHMVRELFNGKVPFKIMFNDSTMEFKEIYDFIEHLTKEWNLDLITVKHSQEEMKEFRTTKDIERKKELSRLMKITAINDALEKYHIKAFIAGIRWDEHEARSKEKYISPRKKHIRVHPILHFTERDIWEYIKYFNVPFVDLYNKGYRSLGEKPFTRPANPGETERSGRDYDKEKVMKNLRRMGYW